MQFKKLSVLMMLPLAFVACSGGSGGGSGSGSSGGSSFGSSISAQFIDDPVKGLEFVTASGVSSSTAAEGRFSCKLGEKVTFKLAGLTLGHAACGEKIFVDDLVFPSASLNADKVGAIIQTFALVGNDELDLSQVSFPNNHLANLNLSDFENSLDAKLDDSQVTYTSGTKPTDIVTPLAARTRIDASLSQYANVGGLASVLDSLLSQEIALTGNLKAGSNADCWKKLKATAGISKEGSVYKLNVNSALYSDDGRTICAGNDPEVCESVPGSDLPKGKIITGRSMSLFSQASQTLPAGPFPFEGETYEVLEDLTLNSRSTSFFEFNPSTSAVSVSGVVSDYYEIPELKAIVDEDAGTILLKASGVSCQYNLSGQVTFPDAGGDDGDNDESSPVADGTYVVDPDLTSCDPSASISLVITSGKAVSVTVEGEETILNLNIESEVDEDGKTQYSFENTDFFGQFSSNGIDFNIKSDVSGCFHVLVKQ